MSNGKYAANSPLSALYVFLILIGILFTLVLYSFGPWLIAIAVTSVSATNSLQMLAPEVQGAVLNGKTIYVPMMQMPFPLIKANPSQIVMALDLETKQTRIALSGLPQGGLQLIPDDSGLWCLSRSTVYRIQGEQTSRSETGSSIGSETAFIRNGKLSVIMEQKRGRGSKSESRYSLYEWNGSNWKFVGQILLPTSGNAISEQKIVLGSTELESASLKFNGPNLLRVISHNGEIHLFCSDGINVLYSRTLDLIPESTASALSLENSPSELSGWQWIGSHAKFQVGIDSQGVMLMEESSSFANSSMRNTVTVFRPNEGKWSESFKSERTGFYLNPRLVSDGARAMVVSMTLGNKLALSEIAGKSMRESRVSVTSDSGMERLTRVTQNLWWTQIVIVLGFAALATKLMNRYSGDLYEFGDITVELASLVRRALAKSVDALLVGAPVQITSWLLIGSQEKIQEWWVDTISGFNSLEIGFVRTIILLILGSVLYCLFWLLIFSVGEGRWGVTPGKWLFGIRVIRTTLRPCGFFRGLVRELLLFIDGMICQWGIGVGCIALTPLRQRVGDLVADSIVIRNPSTPIRELVARRNASRSSPLAQPTE